MTRFSFPTNFTTQACVSNHQLQAKLRFKNFFFAVLLADSVPVNHSLHQFTAVCCPLIWSVLSCTKIVEPNCAPSYRDLIRISDWYPHQKVPCCLILKVCLAAFASVVDNYEATDFTA